MRGLAAGYGFTVVAEYEGYRGAAAAMLEMVAYARRQVVTGPRATAAVRDVDDCCSRGRQYTPIYIHVGVTVIGGES